jgi:hypothetical protein
MSSDLPVAVFELKNYMVIVRQLEERDFDGVTAKVRGIVRCTGVSTESEEGYRLDIFFLTEDSDIPQPIVNLEDKSGAIFLPASDMLTVIDLMRNEKPLYGHLRGDNPQWTSITTTNEPIGAGDEDFKV